MPVGKGLFACARTTEKLEALLKQGRTRQAFDVWRQFPSAYQTPETDQQVKEILIRFMPQDFQPNQPFQPKR